ncbi:MAG: hypothetical protein MUE53_05880 [Chitinophagales bacterium]|jgi:hypothetical protein|nr:hypothetical protein [Chitinophagales bacterium]
MWTEFLKEYLDKLNHPPENLTKFIQEQNSGIHFKGYGTPELEMKFLHQVFLYIRSHHPDFKSISWMQSNNYNDNYIHFELACFEVNECLNINSDINFNFVYDPTEELSSDISFDVYGGDNPEFKAYLKLKNINFDYKDLSLNFYNEFKDYLNKKNAHLTTPCLKFLVFLKNLELNFGMYFFLYTFGNGSKVLIDENGIKITKLNLNDVEGISLDEGINHLDDF